MKVVIWGGTSGLGAALAKRYYVKGHQVVVLGRYFDKYESNFQGQFKEINFIQADITKSDDVKRAIHEEADRGFIDLYIISSGIGIKNKTELEDFDLARNVIEVNTIGTLNAVQAIFPSFYKRQNGHVVLIGSLAGVMGLARNSGYCASKAAVHSMGESWASDWEKHGISISTIAPGFIETPHTEGSTSTMRFIMGVRQAAQKIDLAVTKKKEFYAFPQIPYIVVKLLSILPKWMSHPILKSLKIY